MDRNFSKMIISALWAMTHPFLAFSNIPNTPVSYRKTIIFIAVSGIFWIHLHGYLLFTEPIWITPTRWIFYSLQFALFPIFSWLIISAALWYIYRWAGGTHTLAQIERGVFYLLTVWIVLPLFDIVHLFIPQWIISVPLFGDHPLHISLIFAVIVITGELLALFKVLFPRRLLPYGVMMAFISLPVLKFIGEDLGFLLEKLVFNIGLIDGKYDDYVFGYLFSVPFWILYIFWRGKIEQVEKKKNIIGVLVCSTLFIFIGGVILYLEEPKFPDYQNDSGIVDATHSEAPKNKDFIFSDTIQFDFDLDASPIVELRCIVQFLEVIDSKDFDENLPRARCDVAAGPEIGEGEFTLEGELKDILLNERKYMTSWSNKKLLRTLTAENNDIRVYVEAGGGDKLTFSGVWVEVVRQ